jgi:hypothetical protein
LMQPQTPEEIEKLTNFITTSLMEATKQAIPETKLITTNVCLSEASKRLIANKHRAYRKWKKHNNNDDKVQFYEVKLLLENSLRNDRKQRYKQLMSSLCNSKMCSEAIWRTVRKFHNKRVKQALPKLITYGNTRATTTQEMADVFADYFENEVYAKTVDTTAFHKRIPQQVTDKIHFNRAAQQLHTWNPISTREVKWTMKQLRNSSPGPDNVHNRCLKKYTDLLLQFITTLFHAVIDCGHIPDIWKKANIILLLKPKKENHLPSSYRPISLLSCVGKLLERIVKQRLMLELNQRKILPKHQAGFRPRKSSLYNVVRLERYAAEQLQ